jgi:hypothetical protein
MKKVGKIENLQEKVDLPSFGNHFLVLARPDDCPESYCHDRRVGDTPKGKNFNLGYIF